MAARLTRAVFSVAGRQGAADGRDRDHQGRDHEHRQPAARYRVDSADRIAAVLRRLVADAPTAEQSGQHLGPEAGQQGAGRQDQGRRRRPDQRRLAIVRHLGRQDAEDFAGGGLLRRRDTAWAMRSRSCGVMRIGHLTSSPNCRRRRTTRRRRRSRRLRRPAASAAATPPLVRALRMIHGQGRAQAARAAGLGAVCVPRKKTMNRRISRAGDERKARARFVTLGVGGCLGDTGPGLDRRAGRAARPWRRSRRRRRPAESRRRGTSAGSRSG